MKNKVDNSGIIEIQVEYKMSQLVDAEIGAGTAYSTRAPVFTLGFYDNISAISWQSVLSMEETGEKHRPVT
jgi:hypothetical protein